MRYAVISDIHSNIEALEAFFAKAAALGVDETICLGDIVGYNANPNECVNLVRQKNVRSVMGNHDQRAVGLEEAFDFNLYAREAINWTAAELTPENIGFLKNLPQSLVLEDDFIAIHGWINDLDSYIFSESAAAENFRLMKQLTRPVTLCFFGHTHVPAVYVERGGEVETLQPDKTIKLAKGESFLINPGSIGQPRDSDPRASFLVYDSRKSAITYHRVEYDIKTAAEKVMAAGLPSRLAERLKLGW